MKRLLVIGLTLFSSSLIADNIKLALPPLDEIISVSDIHLSQVQAKVYCRFQDLNSNKIKQRDRYVLTRLDRIEEGRYRVRMGKAQLNAWIPEHQLTDCGYKLITLGEDLDGQPLIKKKTLLDSGLGKTSARFNLRKRLAALLIGKVGEREHAYLSDISHE